MRLSPEERHAALALPLALAAGRSAVAAGERDAAVVAAAMRAVVEAEPLAALDYAAAVDAATLVEAGAIEDPDTVRLLVAALVGPVRLIDNSAAVAAERADRARQLERIG